MRDHGRRGNLDQDGVVDAALVEGVVHLHDALDLVGLDLRRQDVSQRDICPRRRRNITSITRVGLPVAAAAAAAGKPVGYGDDGSEVVAWVAPLCAGIGIVVVEVADQRSEVECTFYGVENELGPWKLEAVGDFCAWNMGADESSCFG